jgi:hypothetical protein
VGEYADNQQLRNAVRREIYNRRNAPAGLVSGTEVAQSVGVPFKSSEFDEAVTDLDTRGEVTRKAGNAMLSITDKGIKEIEEPKAPPEPTISINVQTAHGSIIGTQQNAELTATFNFGDFDRVIEQADEEDKEELKEVREQLRKMLEEEQTVNRGALAKWGQLLEKYPATIGLISRAFIGWLTQQAPSA